MQVPCLKEMDHILYISFPFPGPSPKLCLFPSYPLLVPEKVSVVLFFFKLY